MGHVLIVGGGMAGLALAAALEQAGLEYSVYEQAPELREVGAGIGLWPNALRALDRIGLAAEVVAVGGGGADTELRRWDGRVLVRQRGADYAERWGWPIVGARRSQIQSLLLSRVDERRVHLGRQVARVSADDASARITFDDGETVAGAVVIGADGLRSAVRASLVGDGPPRPTGMVAWLGVSTAPVDVMFETVGPGRKFGGLPHSTQGLWFASALAADAGTSEARQLPVLDELFGHWHAPIAALLQSTDEATVVRRPVFTRRRLRTWASGRVAVIGDAAHPMVPDLGQGGCQALEDALVFADHLAAATRAGSSLADALAEAAATRRRRAARAARTARVFGWVTHRRSPLAQAVAHFALAAPPAAVRLRQLDLIVGAPGRSVSQSSPQPD